jgi:hypothetical protein
MVTAECFVAVNLASYESSGPLFRSRTKCTAWLAESFCKNGLTLLIAAVFEPLARILHEGG